MKSHAEMDAHSKSSIFVIQNDRAEEAGSRRGADLLRLNDVGTSMPFHVIEEESTSSLGARSLALAADLDIVKWPFEEPDRDSLPQHRYHGNGGRWRR